MPKHRLVSGKEVLARLIRALGYKLPSTYIDDLLEWIPEAMGMLQLTNALILTETGEMGCPGELIVANHCVKLPCGYVAIEKLTDEFGKRIQEGHNTNRIETQQLQRLERIASFEVNPLTHQTSTGLPTDEAGNIPPYFLSGSDIAIIPSHLKPAFYTIRGNHLQLSFESGFVKLWYYAIPTCEDGYPLIPDNENYKQAIEWYLIKRLIGSGYEHKVFNYQFADQQWELYAARGMSEVSYYSPDSAEKMHRTLIRLMPPKGYDHDFFHSATPL